MQTFTLTCGEGHDEMTWTTEAADKDAAVTAFMGMDDVRDHVMEAHPDMANASEDKMKEMVTSMVS